MNYNYPSKINKYTTNHKWSLRKQFLLSSNKLNGTLPDCLGETHWQFTPVLGTCKHDQDYMDRWATWPTGTLHFRLLHKQRKPNTDLRNVVAQENQANQIREKKNYGKLCLLFTGFVVCLNIHITNVITGYSLKKK